MLVFGVQRSVGVCVGLGQEEHADVGEQARGVCLVGTAPRRLWSCPAAAAIVSARCQKSRQTWAGAPRVSRSTRPKLRTIRRSVRTPRYVIAPPRLETFRTRPKLDELTKRRIAATSAGSDSRHWLTSCGSKSGLRSSSRTRIATDGAECNRSAAPINRSILSKASLLSHSTMFLPIPSVVSPNCRTCWSSGFSRQMPPTMSTWCPGGTPARRINANLHETLHQFVAQLPLYRKV